MRSRISAVFLIFLLSPSPARAAGELSQTEAIVAALKVNKEGSDDSLKASSTNAMRALLELSKQNIGSAVSHGYRAYGQYRNSDTLDILRARSTITTLKMSSIGAVLQKEEHKAVLLAPLPQFRTSYRRLDPSFLRTGEAAAVAEEFERASGMKREEFLEQMAIASESKLTADDPELLGKVAFRFESIVSRIPNQEFRTQVERGLAKIPAGTRSGLIGKALAKAGAALAAAIPPEVRGDTTRVEALDEAPALSLPIPAGEPPLPGRRPTMVPLFGLYEFRGLEHESFGDDAIGSALRTAADVQKGESIFQQVSRKYRALFPAMTASAGTQ